MPPLPPEDELQESFVRAGGPGGQHANRTETAVQLRFDVRGSRFIPDAVKPRLLKLAGRRADADGVITIEARTHRSQYRNRQEARERLAALVESAFRRPRPRRKTQPTRAAKKKRVREKRRRGEVKRQRAKPSADD